MLGHDVFMFRLLFFSFVIPTWAVLVHAGTVPCGDDDVVALRIVSPFFLLPFLFYRVASLIYHISDSDARPWCLRLCRILPFSPFLLPRISYHRVALNVCTVHLVCDASFPPIPCSFIAYVCR